MLTRSREHRSLALNTRLVPAISLLMLLSMQLTGCAVVKGIFKAGVWVGALSVLAVIALVVYGVSKLGRRS